jgi:hypothetical protein
MYTPCSNEKVAIVQLSYRIGLAQIGLLIAVLQLTACGERSPQGTVDGPCPGESGFGARVESAESEVDVCVADDSVLTVFTYQGWYDVTASETTSDGTLYQFSMMFPHHSRSRKLNLTGSLADARADINGVWFRMMVKPIEGPVTISSGVVAGTFHLGYSDTEVVAGLFENLELDMVVYGQGESAGTQLVPEGFFSILTDIDESSITN